MHSSPKELWTLRIGVTSMTFSSFSFYTSFNTGAHFRKLRSSQAAKFGPGSAKHLLPSIASLPRLVASTTA
jgi:hypothetical protein